MPLSSTSSTTPTAQPSSPSSHDLSHPTWTNHHLVLVKVEEGTLLGIESGIPSASSTALQDMKEYSDAYGQAFKSSLADYQGPLETQDNLNQYARYVSQVVSDIGKNTKTDLTVVSRHTFDDWRRVYGLCNLKGTENGVMVLGTKSNKPPGLWNSWMFGPTEHVMDSRVFVNPSQNSTEMQQKISEGQRLLKAYHAASDNGENSDPEIAKAVAKEFPGWYTTEVRAGSLEEIKHLLTNV